MSGPIKLRPEDLRGYVDFLRDLGIYDLYKRDGASTEDALLQWLSALPSAVKDRGRVLRAATSGPIPASASEGVNAASAVAQPSPFEQSIRRSLAPAMRPVVAGLQSLKPKVVIRPAGIDETQTSAGVRPAKGLIALPDSDPAELDAGEEAANPFMVESMTPVAFSLLAPVPEVRVAPAGRAAALQGVRNTIGDCTRCPLAYAGRHSIVYGDGDPNARLLFVGEGPGADEDQTGTPFVGKAGQLLNNMIGAMGLQRSAVYIANVVKCRPPKNRAPEPIEANTCSQFLLQQIDIVQPEVIVALGATAATYLLGVKQSLSSLRGRWFDVRGAKCAVTYHPAYLLRDPRQKGEAWKDLQRVMVELKLKPPVRG